MPIQDSDIEESRGSENIFTILLVVAALFFAIAIGFQYSELSTGYDWPGGQPQADMGASAE
ncbi:MAG: hypothetical protein JW909_07830 [Planctomycetes bacterium]|nr:hypothetical protein [Planctomycetota bacterium]